jgi:hypothetical protein
VPQVCVANILWAWSPWSVQNENQWKYIYIKTSNHIELSTYARFRKSVAPTMRHPLSTKVGTNFADKWRSV